MTKTEFWEEIIKEFTLYSSKKPMTQEEFTKATNKEILQLPGRWETNQAVIRDVIQLVRYDLPEDYYHTYDAKVRGLTLKEIHRLSKQMVDPDKLSFFIVGDREKVQPGLEQLGLQVIPIDPDGNVLVE